MGQAKFQCPENNRTTRRYGILLGLCLNRSLIIILILPEMMVQQLERHRNWFIKEEAFRVDESKRPGNAEPCGSTR
jgi:hypothetical protein